MAQTSQEEFKHCTCTSLTNNVTQIIAVSTIWSVFILTKISTDTLRLKNAVFWFLRLCKISIWNQSMYLVQHQMKLKKQCWISKPMSSIKLLSYRRGMLKTQHATCLPSTWTSRNFWRPMTIILSSKATKT